ncbi:hypothetical protein Tco_1134709, partial [Tanacetum coccineum]
MLVIKRFRERKKVFRERKLSEKFVQNGVFFSWEWSSIYRQENPTVTAGGPGGSKDFLKHQDEHLKVLTRAHSEKLKQKVELRKKMFDQYVWTRDEHFDPNLKTEPEPYRHRTETVPTPGIRYGFMEATSKSNVREGISGKNISDLNMGDQNVGDGIGVFMLAGKFSSKTKSYANLLVEELIGLVDKIDSGALDDEIYVLTTTERAAAHALVMELAKGFEYVNSDSDTSCVEPNRVTPGV